MNCTYELHGNRNFGYDYFTSPKASMRVTDTTIAIQAGAIESRKIGRALKKKNTHH